MGRKYKNAFQLQDILTYKEWSGCIKFGAKLIFKLGFEKVIVRSHGIVSAADFGKRVLNWMDYVADKQNMGKKSAHCGLWKQRRIMSKGPGNRK